MTAELPCGASTPNPARTRAASVTAAIWRRASTTRTLRTAGGRSWPRGRPAPPSCGHGGAPERGQMVARIVRHGYAGLRHAPEAAARRRAGCRFLGSAGIVQPRTTMADCTRRSAQPD